jgi:hypothetical protein
MKGQIMFTRSFNYSPIVSQTPRKTKGRKRPVVLAAAAAVVLGFLAGIASAQDAGVTVTVYGHSGPWSWKNGGLNTNYQYCLGEEAAPTVISAASGLPFSAGDSLTIGYLSGGVAINVGPNRYDADGDPTNPLNNSTYGNPPGNTYPPAPSYYMDPSTYPINCGELVGTFANSSGEIVDTPFKIGDLGTFTIPAGGTQLQLGANDDDYYDNSDSWSIQITESVPELASLSLLVLAGGTLLLRRRRTN